MKRKLRKSLGGVLVAVLLTNAICPLMVMADASNHQESGVGEYDGDENGIDQEPEGDAPEVSGENSEEAEAGAESREESESKSGEEGKAEAEGESGNESEEDSKAESEDESKEESKTESEDENKEESKSESEDESKEESKSESPDEGKDEAEGSAEGETKDDESHIDDSGNMAGDKQIDDSNGEREKGILPDANGWFLVDGKYYWYIDGVRQGMEGGGLELYDSEADAWYWLDAGEGGARAVNRDVYLASKDSEEGGRWVRYDANGQMVRGWSEDRFWYFNPVNGAMAKGTVLIDGVEYEFDVETGRRITRIGFEEFGLVCNVDTEQEFEYLTRTYRDKTLATVAKARFSYNKFTEDENHEGKDGYQWKQAVISLVYDDENAMQYGCCWSLLYNVDYYTFMEEPVEALYTDDIVTGQGKLMFRGMEYDITTNYAVKENWRDENGAMHVVICFECHVPTDYDGMVIALYDTANSGEEAAMIERLNESSLMFRMD